MINYEQTDNGGSVCVAQDTNFCTLTYQLSNKTSPLSIRCSVDKNSAPKTVGFVVCSLLEKYSPKVLLISSKDIAVRFIPKFGNMFRCWTQGDQTVYAESFSSRNIFERVCSISYAMQNSNFVRVENNEIKLFGYCDVLKRLRKNTTSLEFLTLKEECDYYMKTVAVKGVCDLIETAEKNLYTIPQKDRLAFQEVSKQLLREQGQESFNFDTKYSYIQEAVVGIVLPAIVKYGLAHPFTEAVLSEFSKQASVYTRSSEELISSYSKIID